MAPSTKEELIQNTEHNLPVFFMKRKMDYLLNSVIFEYFVSQLELTNQFVLIAYVFANRNMNIKCKLLIT